MLARLPVSWITSGLFHEILESASPVLIACIRKDNGFLSMMKELDTVAEYFQEEMDVFYALEDMFPFFSGRYGIFGTPTFIILHKGKVIGTILGKNPTHELIRQSTIILLNHHSGGAFGDQVVQPAAGICQGEDEGGKQ